MTDSGAAEHDNPGISKVVTVNVFARRPAAGRGKSVTYAQRVQLGDEDECTYEPP